MTVPVDLLAAVDPGTSGSGLVIFGGGRLHRATFARGPGHDQPGRFLLHHDDEVVTGAARLIVEQPQVYAPGRSKGDPGDLIAVALVAGAWLREGARLGYQVETTLPAAWKGQLPKQLCRARARAVLSADELGCIERVAMTQGGSDMWDAIALGLVKLGRLRLR